VETGRFYNSMGIGAVRDPGLDEAAMGVYLRAHEEGRLTVRTNAMYRLDPAEDTHFKLRQLETFKLRPGHGDDWLAVDSLKIFSDGGVEGGWLSAAYANDEHYHGHGLINKDDFYSLVREARLRGWKVGTHAVGDLAVEMVVDTYERVMEDLGAGDEHGLVIEHAFFADEQVRSRVIALGIPVTVQHPLLYALGGNMLTYWGEERTREVMPIRAWLDEGGQLSSGSDCNVAPVSPLLSIWGLVTRGTLNAGVQGEEYAIDRRTAFRLYTIEGARLIGAEGHRGRIKEGYFADFVCYQDDPLSCDLDDLPGLTPSMTWVGGQCVYEAPSRVSVSSTAQV
jgi:predicted amidohydrolase YtcJ